MQEALKNPHYKKIWEKVIMNRHPECKSLNDIIRNTYCLFLRVDNYQCPTHPQKLLKELNIGYDIAVPQSIGECWDFWNYKIKNIPQCDLSILGISFDVRKPYDYIGYGLSMEKVETLVILSKLITLEDILILCKKYCDGILSLVVNDDGYATILNSEKNLYIRVQLTTPLHEQTPETWEKIANLID